MSDQKLTGKSAIVTGGSRGIGKAIAVLLAAHGADIAFNHFDDEDRAKETGAEIEALGRRVHHAHCDVSSVDAVRSFYTDAVSTLGDIGILVNNAGHNVNQNFTDITEADHDRMFGVHVKGTFFMTQAVFRDMVARGEGRIINVTSQLAYKGAGLLTHYASAKGANMTFTRALALECAGTGVLVNAVAPGVTNTDLLTPLADELLDTLRAAIPLGRFGEVSEIAPAALLLAPPRAVSSTAPASRRTAARSCCDRACGDRRRGACVTAGAPPLAPGRATCLVAGRDFLAPAVDRAVASLRLPAGGWVLDAGAGSGSALPALARAVGAAGSVRAVDIDPTVLPLATAHATRHGMAARCTVEHADLVDVVERSATEPGGGFDADLGRRRRRARDLHRSRRGRRGHGQGAAPRRGTGPVPRPPPRGRVPARPRPAGEPPAGRLRPTSRGVTRGLPPARATPVLAPGRRAGAPHPRRLPPDRPAHRHRPPRAHLPDDHRVAADVGVCPGLRPPGRHDRDRRRRAARPHHPGQPPLPARRSRLLRPAPDDPGHRTAIPDRTGASGSSGRAARGGRARCAWRSPSSRASRHG
ncbi:hypothetical protein CFP66_46430 [Pseudonocardia sp. MH-G8]|nr:hypothetical protein CFP66_46430 [Pseudonocardia sp. MH-G8]